MATPPYGALSPLQTKTVTNSIGDDMVTFSSTFATQGYVVTNNTCGSTLAPLQSCNVDVACVPTQIWIPLRSARVLLHLCKHLSRNRPVGLSSEGHLCCATICTGSIGISGTAIQGGMNGAAITAVAVNANGSDGSTLATTTANNSGNFSLFIANPQAGPVRVRASGGSYVSEQDGATITSPSPLSALLPSLPNSVSDSRSTR